MEGVFSLFGYLADYFVIRLFFPCFCAAAKDELSLPFMSGRAFSSSMLDSLLCSANTNPLILPIVRLLLFGGCDDDDDENIESDDTASAGGNGAAVEANPACPNDCDELSSPNRADGQAIPQGIHLMTRVSRPASEMGVNSDGDGDEDEDVTTGVMPQRVINPLDLFDESPIYQEQCFHSLPKVHLNLNEPNSITLESISADMAGEFILELLVVLAIHFDLP